MAVKIRVLCSAFERSPLADVCKKAALWQRNHTMRCKIRHVSKFIATSRGSLCDSTVPPVVLAVLCCSLQFRHGGGRAILIAYRPCRPVVHGIRL